MPGTRAVKTQNLRRDTLRKIAERSTDPIRARIAALGVMYSEEKKLLSNHLNKLAGQDRIFPRHLPTQASFRWSTIGPNITGWPRECICPSCPRGEHEWTEQCWSVRNILMPDPGYVMVSWDHDNAEGRVHDIIVNDQEAIKAHLTGLDLHTITCCKMFKYDMPSNLFNPHTSVEDAAWRAKYHWQGKDTKQRVLAKNFNHGSKYSTSWTFINEIPGVEQYNVTKNELRGLAEAYILSKGDVWNNKLRIMDQIRRNRIARSLYGGRRIFFDSSTETGREGFSHMISGTVSQYNNQTLIALDEMLGDCMLFMHNAHDGNKIQIREDYLPSKDELAKVIQREVTYQDRSITLTAGIKIHG